MSRRRWRCRPRMAVSYSVVGGSVCILGNGPSLLAERIPLGMMLLGVNRSNEVAWSPLLVTCDTGLTRKWKRRGSPGPPAEPPLAYILMDRVLPDPPECRGDDDVQRKMHRLWQSDFEKEWPRAHIMDDCPRWIGFSGLFAMWYAHIVLGFSCLWLLGFDCSTGHFDGGDRAEREPMLAKLQKFRKEYPDVSTWRWVDDEWVSER